MMDLDPGPRDLDEAAARYVARVHRLRPGDRFVAFDPQDGIEAQAVVLLSHRGHVRCEIEKVVKATCVPCIPAWLILGLCKADRFEWALREATALGATEIVPLWMARSSSAGLKSDEKKLVRWQRILVEGARQSGRGNIPRLHEPMGWDELETIQSTLPEDVVKVCLWEGAKKEAGPFLRKANALALIVGPEGGLETEEASRANTLGFSLVSLGPRILRTETAVIAALGAWMLSH